MSEQPVVVGIDVAKLHVDYGDDVTAGQLLAEIDTGAVVRARLAEAKADLETARREARARCERDVALLPSLARLADALLCSRVAAQGAASAVQANGGG